MSTPRRPDQTAFDRKKFKALVHYVCEKAVDPSCLGSVKLNKVLWYSDVISYLTTGKPITGETYIKRQHGPVPRDVVPVISELVREDKITRAKVDHFGFTKHEYVAIKKADISVFSGPEIALVDEAFKHVCLDHTATSVSKETHDIVWELADMGEVIPYEAVFATGIGEIDEADLEWAKGKLKNAA